MSAWDQLFNIDRISIIMILLAGFVVTSVASFSYRYLQGDRKKRTFFLYLTVLFIMCLSIFVSDHLLILLISWGLSNFFLSKLILHKCEWPAARNSSHLALKNFSLGLLFLGGAFGLLYLETGETSIRLILNSSLRPEVATVASVSLFLAAMTQSAQWPFHKWLTSSLNSPTPASAVMHAGLINGGGFLLVRFAPLFFEQPMLLNIIFMVSMLSAFLGTFWKLMQSDVKRMLACSTMGQMGFMMAQFGLGLAPAAIAHLCWHGLFKAYLFLASGSAAQEKRYDFDSVITLKQLAFSSVCGAIGATSFAWASDKNFLAGDTTLFLILISMIAGIQFSLPIIRSHSKFKIPFALIASAIMGGFYGISVFCVESMLEPLNILSPQSLNVFHVFALLALVVGWFGIIFIKSSNQISFPDWALKIYVRMLNASQPHLSTITANRNQYQF